MLDYQIDFALLLYDEFDGAAITDVNVLFRCGGRIVTPLRKKEGFYIFRGLGLPEAELEISRPHYHKELKRVIKSCLDPGNPVERVRLARAYPGNFSDCEWLHGSCAPNSPVLAFAEERQIKMQAGEDDKNRLTILGCAASGLVGRRFAPDEKSGESFLLTRMLAPGVYLSDKEVPIPSGAPRSMIRAYLSKSGADGSYHIPVEHGQSDKICSTAYYDGRKEKWVSASVTGRS